MCFNTFKSSYTKEYPASTDSRKTPNLLPPKIYRQKPCFQIRGMSTRLICIGDAEAQRFHCTTRLILFPVQNRKKIWPEEVLSRSISLPSTWTRNDCYDFPHLEPRHMGLVLPVSPDVPAVCNTVLYPFVEKYPEPCASVGTHSIGARYTRGHTLLMYKTYAS